MSGERGSAGGSPAPARAFRPRSRARASRPQRVLPFLAGLFLTNCYEIPPELPDDDDPPDTHPPTAVYDLDPFAARNRWFQRAFKLGPTEARRAGARRPSSGTAEAFSDVDELEPVDRAELIALSEAAGEEGADLESGGVPRDCPELASYLFRSDVTALLVAVGGRVVSGSGSLLESELARALEPLSRTTIDASSESLKARDPTCWNRPTALSGTGWKEVAADLPAGLLPSVKDPRWTRVLRREAAGGRETSGLLRLRVARDHRGEPALSYLASECWVLERANDRVTAVVWRFDRAASLAGEEPWRRIAPDEELSIRNPLEENGEWITGTTEGLCLGCHGAGEETAPVAVFPATREEQLARVRGIFRRAGLGSTPAE